MVENMFSGEEVCTHVAPPSEVNQYVYGGTQPDWCPLPEDITAGLLKACRDSRAELESIINDFGLGYNKPEEHPLVRKLDAVIALGGKS